MARVNFEQDGTTYQPGPVAADPLTAVPRTTIGTQPVPGTTPQPGPGTSTTPTGNGTTPITFPQGATYGGGSTLTPPHGTPPPNWTPQFTYGDLSNPTSWMQLVGNDANLKTWVTQNLGVKGAAVPGLADYYVSKIKAQPGANPTEQAGSANYWLQKLQSDPNVTGHALPPEGGGNLLGYDDPSAQMYLQQLLKTLGVLNTPADTSALDALKSLATTRVAQLQGAPYTDAESAALTTQYRDPLTQARDQAKQQELQDLSRRGFGATSPLVQGELNKIDQAYTGGIAKGANQLGVQAVQQKQANANQALSILSNLVGVETGAQSQTDQRAQTAASIAQGFPNFDQQRLDSLLRASGGDPTSSALSAILGLGNLNNNTNAINNQNDSAYASALAQFIYGLTNAFH